MRRKEFIEFYKVGLEVSVQDYAPTMYDRFGEDVNAKESRNEYAFYFAKHCIMDVNGRNRKEWGMMNKLHHAILYRFPMFIGGLFNPRKVKKPVTAESLMAMLDAEK